MANSLRQTPRGRQSILTRPVGEVDDRGLRIDGLDRVAGRWFGV